MKMKLLLPTLILALRGAQALVARDASCAFQLTTTSGIPLGQLDDGQVRTNLPPATFYLSSTGGITDAQGRGCILTRTPFPLFLLHSIHTALTSPPSTAQTSQFQCDDGASPTPGFSISCDAGTLSHDGTSSFFACATGADATANIYTTSIDPVCTPLTLSTTTCRPCPPPPPAPPSSCPLTLSNGAFEFPHLIVPISPLSPTTAYGTVFAPSISPTRTALFAFDIPPTAAGKTCTLVFLFPLQSALRTSSFSLGGAASALLAFARLAAPPDLGTTFATRPAPGADYGAVRVVPGNAYGVVSGACEAGARVGYSLAAADAESELTYFQDWNPAP
ncbi:MAG: hypothetical protein M1829_003586 [Trizodia sp. TS-e1964]|nr:MAG: hypothetical protein M1829_003586 [Trizodia sp. TS-e1964]